MKFKKLGTYADAKRSGRPRKTTPRTDILIKRKAMNSSTYSAKKIRPDLNETGISVSRRTVSSRSVEEFGLKSRKSARKPSLILKIKKASSVCIAA